MMAFNSTSRSSSKDQDYGSQEKGLAHVAGKGYVYPDVYEVTRCRKLDGKLRVPASKSITQRYFNLALLGRRPLVVRHPLRSEDPELFLKALQTTGFRVDERPEAGAGGDAVELRPLPPATEGKIFCGNGGTMFRFLTAALTTVPGTWTLDGIARLRERPVGPLLDALRQLGAQIHCQGEEGFAPLRITGASLSGGRAVLDAGASSQYLSALMMAGLAAQKSVEVEVAALASEPYVDLTLDAIAEFGGHVAEEAGVYRIDNVFYRGGQEKEQIVSVEGDFSAAAYPAAAAALTGGTVTIEGLREGSRQGDRKFIDLLATMGARVRWRDDLLRLEGGDLVAVAVDLSTMPDQVPTLAALAPFARGTTRITGVAHLRIKESDRLRAMAVELRRLGASVEELEDGLVIPGVWAESEPPSGTVAVETWGDHRIAMSLALVGLRRGGVRIQKPEVVIKSYPGFWRDLELLQRK